MISKWLNMPTKLESVLAKTLKCIASLSIFNRRSVCVWFCYKNLRIDTKGPCKCPHYAGLYAIYSIISLTYGLVSSSLNEGHVVITNRWIYSKFNLKKKTVAASSVKPTLEKINLSSSQTVRHTNLVSVPSSQGWSWQASTSIHCSPGLWPPPRGHVWGPYRGSNNKRSTAHIPASIIFHTVIWI